jgi:hypothetical protein
LLDDPSDLSCQDGTGQYAVDGTLLSCKQPIPVRVLADTGGADQQPGEAELAVRGHDQVADAPGGDHAPEGDGQSVAAQVGALAVSAAGGPLAGAGLGALLGPALVGLPLGARHGRLAGGDGGGHQTASGRRILAALLRKAAASFPHEATACREKVEALRAKYGL